MHKGSFNIQLNLLLPYLICKLNFTSRSSYSLHYKLHRHFVLCSFLCSSQFILFWKLFCIACSSCCSLSMSFCYYVHSAMCMFITLPSLWIKLLGSWSFELLLVYSSSMSMFKVILVRSSCLFITLPSHCHHIAIVLFWIFVWSSCYNRAARYLF